MMLTIMVSGLTGVSISRYAYAHYLSVTQTSAAPPSSNATSVSAPPSSNATSRAHATVPEFPGFLNASLIMALTIGTLVFMKKRIWNR